MISLYYPEQRERARRLMAVSFKEAYFPEEIILTDVRWYIAYPLSTRHVEELMLERGVHVNYGSVARMAGDLLQRAI